MSVRISSKVPLVGVILYAGILAGCPTCVGRVDGDSAPFFTKECYEWCAVASEEEIAGVLVGPDVVRDDSRIEAEGAYEAE